MKITTIVAALLGACLSVSARSVPRGVSSPYGGSKGSSPIGGYAPIGTGQPSTPVSPVVPPGSDKGHKSNLICGAAKVDNYTILSGDTLTLIAKKFNSGICDIFTLNKLKNPNLIILGTTIKIPVNCTTPDNTSCLPPPAPVPTETCVPGVGSTYTVVSGDTLGNIANDFNITLASVIGANPQISKPDAIQVGQVIKIPICPNSKCNRIGTYTIRSGDLFVDLARKYRTRIGQIKSLNPTVDPSKIQPGDIIILPQKCHNVTASA